MIVLMVVLMVVLLDGFRAGFWKLSFWAVNHGRAFGLRACQGLVRGRAKEEWVAWLLTGLGPALSWSFGQFKQ